MGSLSTIICSTQDDEEISLTLFPRHPLPSFAKRQATAARMDRILDKAAENMSNIPDSEYEATVDEAMEHVRPWKK